MNQSSSRHGLRLSKTIARSANPIKVSVVSKKQRDGIAKAAKCSEVIVLAIHRFQASKQRHLFVCGYELIGMDLEKMIADGAGCFPG
jgi:hypothetical protein